MQILVVVIGAVLLSGCTQPGTITPPSPTVKPNPIANSITGHVYLDEHAVGGAYVEAVSVDGTDRRNTTTGDDGAYTLNINPGARYNLTATWQGLRHTVWPVSVGSKYNVYNIPLTATPKSFIAGTGYSMGGPEGYNNSRPLIGFELYATPADENGKLTATIGEDWSYSLEVEPGVMYHMERYAPSVNFNYRNSDDVLSGVIVGPNETAIIDYVVLLP